MSQSPPDLRAMGQQMIGRLMSAPAQSLVDPGYALRVLEIAGRRSGAPVDTPIGVLARDGRRFLVSPDASRDWVANLRSAGTATLKAGDLTEHISAVELHGPPAAEVVVGYLAVVTVPWAVAAFRVPDGTSVEEVEARHLDRMAVFEVLPAADPVPAESRLA
jgi:hypothetical protein